tara:strand:- start:336 stop:518 length:183 start_codon:yes stop_codon:yes gene_type:complete
MAISELERLNSEHAKLDSAIEKHLDNTTPDQNRLSVMKKHKIWLKDKIQQLESKEQKQNV